MVALILYRVKCTSFSHTPSAWMTSVPTICPSDGGVIDTNYTTIVSSLSFGNSRTLTSADSPFSVLSTTEKILFLDTSGGNIIINLPSVASLDKFSYHFKKTSASNTVTINRNGADTINLLTSKTLSSNNEIFTITGDSAAANWDISPGLVSYVVAGIDTSLSTTQVDNVIASYINIGNLQIDTTTISSLNNNNIIIQPNGSGNTIISTITGSTSASSNLVLRSTTNATKGQVYIDETTVSSSITTGALRVGGGVGISGATYVGGIGNFTSGTSASSNTTGALVVTGGVGISGAAYIGNIQINTNTISTTNTNGNLSLIPNGTGVVVTPTLTGSTTTGNNLVLRANSANLTTGFVYITSSLDATSTVSGALRSDGGLAVAKAAYIGGIVNATSNVSASSNTTGSLVVTGGVGISGAAYIGNIQINTNTISTTNTNGNLSLIPNGTGEVQINIDPTQALSVPPKQFLNAMTGDLYYKMSSRVKTSAALAAYTRISNDLTANANGAISTIDGVTVAVNDRILVDSVGTTVAADRGIYTVTQLGSAGTPWILTRATDMNTSGETLQGSYTTILEGTLYAKQTYMLTTSGTITLNTTGLWFDRIKTPQKYFTIVDSKTTGTNGGTFTRATWTIRTLNTLFNTSNTNITTTTNNFVSLSANVFTLQPGEWTIICYAPGYRCTGHQARLWNTTAGTDDKYGSTVAAANSVTTDSVILYNLYLSTATSYRVEHNCVTTRATDGLGLACGFSATNASEIYTRVFLVRK